MVPTTWHATPVALLAAGFLLTACVPATSTSPASPAPQAFACEDSVYLRLRAVSPDSLSDREWVRLHELEELCTAEQRAAAAAEEAPGAENHRAGMHRARWLWMPAVMLFGGLMWLMMGG